MFAAALTLYGLTLAPGLCWGDGARVQLDAVMGGSTYLWFPELAALPFDGLPYDRLGVAAWDHPLFVMLGHVAAAVPFGAPAARLSALSALFGALAVAAAWHLMRELSGDTVAASIGALSLALAHTFWFHAVSAEVYTLHALFMLAVLGLTLRSIGRDSAAAAWLLAALVGLGMANHLLLALTALPCLMIGFAKFPGLKHWAEEPKLAEAGFHSSARRLSAGIAAIVVAFMLAFAPWWIQALRMARLVGAETMLTAAFALPWLPGRLSASPGEMAGNLPEYCGWLLYQFGPLGVLLGALGAGRLTRVRPRQGALLLAVWSVHVLFSANYAVADRFAFHLPSYIVWAIWIAVAVAGLRRRLGSRSFIALAVVLLAIPPLCYTAAPRVLRAAGVDDRRLGIQPIGSGARDAMQYFLQPWKHNDRSAEQWARGTLEALPERAHLIAAWPVDQEAYLVLRYIQLVERRRSDVRLDLLLDGGDRTLAERALSRLAQQAACRPVLMASLHHSYGVRRLNQSFLILPQSGVWRLLPRKAVAARQPCSATPEAIDLQALLRAMRR